MRLAGIHLSNGDRVWTDSGTFRVQVLDRVTVRTGEEEAAGWVFAAPEQLLGSVGEVQGEIIAIQSERTDVECGDLPGAAMPPLGSRVEAEDGSGIAVKLDGVHRRVTLAADGGSEVSLTLSEDG